MLATLVDVIDDAMIAELNDLLRREQEAYREADETRALKLSVDFHRELARLAGNGVLESYLNDIIRRTPLVILAHLGDDELNRCRNQEHEAIVDALARGDLDTAQSVMNQHLLHIESKLRLKPEQPVLDIESLLRPEVSGEAG